MSSIDNRIVNMIFNNKQFEQGIKETTDSLGKLNNSLNTNYAGKGLKQMGDDVEAISGRFTNMGIVGMTVLEELTKSAMNAGKNIAKSLLDPILTGGKRRALNIEQAKFQFEGLGMDIEAAMSSANKAVSGTAFGLDEAAKVAAQFGASGMEAGDDMTQALRAISGVAAMTSSSYEDIGRIFTTVSGNGRVMGNQLLQLSGRGLNAAAAIAKSMGISEGAVREMVTKGQIDFETFYKAMDEAFGEHATAANKTFTGSLSNMRAALSRIGASIYTPALENLRDIFNAMRPVIDGVHEALKPLINKFSELTTNITKGLVKALESISFDPVTKGEKPASNLARAFNGLKAALELAVDAIKIGVKFLGILAKAFSPIFKHIGSLIGFMGDLVVGFRDLVKGGEVAAGIFKPFKDVTESLSGAFGGLRKDTDKVTDGFKPLQAMSKGVKKMFELMAKGVSNIGPLLTKVIKAAGQAIRDIDYGAIMDIANVGIFAGILVIVKKFFGKLGGLVGKGSGIIDSLLSPLNSLRDVLQSYAKSINAKTIVQIAGALVLLTGAIFVLSTIDPSKLANSVGALSLVLAEMIGALKIMSTTLDPKSTRAMATSATTMIKMSVAVLVLAGAMERIGRLEWAEIGKGMVGIGAMLAMLTTTAIVLSKQSGRMMKGAGGLISFAIALNILVPVIEKLGAMPFNSLMKGLGGLGVALVEIAIFTKLVDPKGMMRMSVAMVAMGAAMNIFAKAVGAFGEQSVNQLVKGLGSLAVVFTEIAIFTRIMEPKKMISTSVGLTILSVAMKQFAKAVAAMGQLSVKELAKGLGGMGASLVIIAGAMHLMPKGLIAKGTGLIFVATAINVLNKSLQLFGGMSVKEIAKSLGVLAGSLGILATGLYLMQGTAGGSAALMLAAVAIGMLAPALKLLSKLSLKEIAKSLGFLSATLVVLGAAGFALAPVVPVIAALSGVLMVLSLATLATGAGVLALATGLNLLTLNTVGTVGAIGMLVSAIAVGIPKLAKSIAHGFVEFAVVLGQSAEKLVKAFSSIALTIINTLGELLPKVIDLVGNTIVGLIQKIAEMTPLLIQAGSDILLALLKGIGDNVANVVVEVSRIINKFLGAITASLPNIVYAGVTMIMTLANAIADNMKRIVDAGFDLVIGFLNGLADSIRENHGRLFDAGLNIIDAVLGAIASAVTRIPEIAATLLSTLIREIKSGFGRSKEAGAGLGRTIIDGIKGAIKNIFGTGVDLVTRFVDGIKSKLGFGKRAGKDSGRAAKDGVEEGSSGTHSLGQNMMYGFRNGISSMASSVANAAKNVAYGAINGVKNFLDIRSPSRVLKKLGEHTGEGFAIGIDSMRGAVEKSSTGLAETTTDAIDELIDLIDGLDDDPDFAPTIRPIFDLDEVDEAREHLNSIFDGDEHILRTMRNIPVDRKDDPKRSDSAQGKVVNNNFTQNNYSPKPLNRLEIYRQTRNQLALQGDGNV